MKINDLLQYTFRALRPTVEAHMAEEASSHLILHTDGHLVLRHLSASSSFCRTCVQTGYLTEGQMQHATQRYLLGMARDGGVIFWQMDTQGMVYDGKVMYYREDCHRDHGHNPTWVSSELHRFYLGTKADSIGLTATHCLFGTHLLRSEKCSVISEKAVAVVEAEKTAVIMSEHFPQHLWMATGGLNELTPVKLFPLRGRKIILFPDTDQDGQAYALWYSIAQQAQRLLGQPITVSPLLEQYATPAQKAAKIDLVDFLYQGTSEQARSLFAASKRRVWSLHPTRLEPPNVAKI